MSKTFNGNSTRNARIRIDYSGVKPKVQFSYPSKHGVEGSMLSYIFVFWIIINIPLLLYIAYFTQTEDYYTVKTMPLNKVDYNLSDYQDFLRYVNDTQVLENTFNLINEDDYVWKYLLKKLYPSIFLYLYMLVLPYLIYRPFKKKWNRLYPKFQGFIAKKKIMVFKPEDIKYSEENGYYCEVPVFSNIVLNYEATKDFSKYLNFVEIEEHKFKYMIHKHKSKKKLSKSHREMHIRRALNEWLWYARFYFKDKPKSGSLEVIFK